MMLPSIPSRIIRFSRNHSLTPRFLLFFPVNILRLRVAAVLADLSISKSREVLAFQIRQKQGDQVFTSFHLYIVIPLLFRSSLNGFQGS